MLRPDPREGLAPTKVQAIDCVDQIPALRRIGKTIAREQVHQEDFDGFLDDGE